MCVLNTYETFNLVMMLANAIRPYVYLLANAICPYVYLLANAIRPYANLLAIVMYPKGCTSMVFITFDDACLGDDKIAPIEVGYPVATKSGTMAE